MHFVSWIAAATMFLTIGQVNAHAADTVTLDNYTCEMFLADIVNPEAGDKLLRSMMIMSWATGYTSAYQKAEPRADTQTMGAIAIVIGTACRKVPKHTVIDVVTGMVSELVSAQPPVTTTVATAMVPGASYWNQNGSIVRLVAEGANRKFQFEKPRDELAATGVKPGTLLFEGKKDRNHYVGTAYTFAAKCKPKGFQVVGDISADEKQVTLHGKRPALNANCKATTFIDENLVLTYIVQPEAK